MVWVRGHPEVINAPWDTFEDPTFTRVLYNDLSVEMTQSGY